MSILVSYETNAPLRKRYYELNNVKQVQVWPEYAGGSLELFQVYLSDGVTPGGFSEGPLHATYDRAVEWARQYAPGLEVVDGRTL